MQWNSFPISFHWSQDLEFAAITIRLHNTTKYIQVKELGSVTMLSTIKLKQPCHPRRYMPSSCTMHYYRQSPADSNKKDQTLVQGGGFCWHFLAWVWPRAIKFHGKCSSCHDIVPSSQLQFYTESTQIGKKVVGGFKWDESSVPSTFSNNDGLMAS